MRKKRRAKKKKEETETAWSVASVARMPEPEEEAASEEAETAESASACVHAESDGDLFYDAVPMADDSKPAAKPTTQFGRYTYSANARLGTIGMVSALERRRKR